MRAIVGLPSTRKGSKLMDKIQDRLAVDKLGVYLPQMRYGRSTNIGMAYDWLTASLCRRPGGHNWIVPMINEAKRFPESPLFMYNDYHYKRQPKVLRWLLRDGGEYTVDSIRFHILVSVLTESRIWLERVGVAVPAVGIDEPPHLPKYGLTPAVEERVVKFCKALAAANWLIYFCTPHPSHYAFWKERVEGVIWVRRDDVGGVTWPVIRDCWLYNAPSFDGLRERLHKAGALGYWQWSAVEEVTAKNQGPLLFSRTGEPLPAYHNLLAALA